MKNELYTRRTQLRKIARPSTAALFVAFAVATAVPTLQADDFLYLGTTGDSQWETTGNWLGAVPNEDTNNGVITFAPPQKGLGLIMLDKDKKLINLDQVIFNNGTNYSIVRNIEGGNSWTFNDAVTTGKDNIVNKGGYQFIDVSIKTGDVFSVDAQAGQIVLQGTTQFKDQIIVKGDGSFQLDTFFISTEAGANILKQGTGALIITDEGSFDGGVVVEEGGLLLGDDAALGSGDVLIESGSYIGAYGKDTTVTNSFTFEGDVSAQGYDTLTLAGQVELGDPIPQDDSGNEFVSVNVGQGATLILSGVVDSFGVGTGEIPGTGPGEVPPYHQSNIGMNIAGEGTFVIDSGADWSDPLAPDTFFELEGDLNVESATLEIGRNNPSTYILGNVNVTNNATILGDGTLAQDLNVTNAILFLDANDSVEHTDSETKQITVVNPEADTLTVNGNLSVDADSVIVLEIKDDYTKDASNTVEKHGTRNGSVIVEGDVDIAAGARVVVQMEDNSRVRHNDEYMIIDSVGTGTNVDYNLIPDDPNDSVVTFILPREFEYVLKQEVSGVGDQNDLKAVVSVVDFEEIAFTDNEKSVAVALQDIREDVEAGTVTGDMADVVNAFLGMESGEFNEALQTLTPEEAADKMVTMGFHGMKAQNNNVNARLNDLRYNTNLWSSHTQNYFSAIMEQASPAETYDLALQTTQYFDDQVEIARDTFDPDMMERVGFFVTGYGTFGEVGNQDDMVGYDWETYGATIGMDYRLSDELIVGAYTGYSYSEAKVLRGSGSSTVNSFNGGVYASYEKDGSYLSGMAGLGYSMYDNNRTIKFADELDRSAKSDPTGVQFTAAGTIGHDFTAREWVFGPYAQLEFANLAVEEYKETGAGAAGLEVDEMDVKSLLGRVGAHVGINIDLDRITFMPEAHAAYQHQFYDTSQSLGARFVGSADSAFNFDTRELSENAGILGAGITAYNRESGNSLYLFYDGEFGENEYTIHTFRGGMRFAF
ncbi:autotransporter domain-containing protein [Planctomycetota bacterium]|nr:autotransporter domain-containing protein [Planctomycetota bacterium]